MTTSPRQMAGFAALLLWGLVYIAWFCYLVLHSRDFMVAKSIAAVCAAADHNAAGVTRDIRFDVAHADQNMLAAGWSEPEPWGVWNDGTQALLVLPIPMDVRTRGGALSFQLLVPSNPEFPRLPVRVVANNQEVVSWNLGEIGNDDVRELHFDASALQARSCVEIAFSFKNAYRPLDEGLGEDARLLSIGLKRATWLDTTPPTP